MFNIAAHSIVPDLGGAVVSGLQSGQNLRKGALQMQEAQALQQRQAALGQLAPQIAQGNQGALNQALSLDPTGQGFRGALDVQAAQAQAAKDKQEAETQFFAKAAVTLESAPEGKRALLYDAFQKMAVQSGFITPDEIEPYSPKVMEELAPFKMQARKLEDMTTTAQQDREYALRSQELQAARAERMGARADAAAAREDAKQATIDAKLEVQNEKDIQKLSDRVEKTGITDVMTSLNNLQNLVPAEGNIEGMSGASAALPDWMTSERGQAIRQEVSGLRNTILKARSGGAVTPQEAERLLNELGEGVFKNDKQLRRGIENVQKTMQNKMQNTFAGFSQDVVSEYQNRGGLSINAAAQEPAPVMPNGWIIEEIQ